jgi:hypothetical protein
MICTAESDSRALLSRDSGHCTPCKCRPLYSPTNVLASSRMLLMPLAGGDIMKTTMGEILLDCSAAQASAPMSGSATGWGNFLNGKIRSMRPIRGFKNAMINLSMASRVRLQATRTRSFRSLVTFKRLAACANGNETPRTKGREGSLQCKCPTNCVNSHQTPKHSMELTL